MTGKYDGKRMGGRKSGIHPMSDPTSELPDAPSDAAPASSADSEGGDPTHEPGVPAAARPFIIMSKE